MGCFLPLVFIDHHFLWLDSLELNWPGLRDKAPNISYKIFEEGCVSKSDDIILTYWVEDIAHTTVESSKQRA